MYKYIQNQIKECDKEIERMLSNQINDDNNKREHYIDKKVHKRLNKNAPYHNDHGYEFLDQKRKRKVLEAKKLIRKFGMSTNELSLSINAI